MGAYVHLSSVFFIKITLTNGSVVASLYDVLVRMLAVREMSLSVMELLSYKCTLWGGLHLTLTTGSLVVSAHAHAHTLHSQAPPWG